VSLALDTNVLVRLLTRDDDVQCAAAEWLVNTAVSHGERVMVSTGVLLETEWVLRSRYNLVPEKIRLAFNAILETDEIMVQELSILEESLKIWREHSGADFADCVHVATAVQSNRILATFDKNAAKLHGAALIPQ
jgi:predicted nucleic-acid-binding protein